MNKKNIMIGYAPNYGKKIIDELFERNDIDFCFDASCDNCKIVNEKLIEFNMNLGIKCDYSAVIDLNKLPVIDKELLELMLPYESMIIRMEERETELPTVNYEDAKINYLIHLRFWNYIFVKYKFTGVFFEEVPHRTYSYLIYCLAKVKKIKILLSDITSIKNIRVYGVNDFEDNGSHIEQYYNKIRKLVINENELKLGIREFFNKIKNNSSKKMSEKEIVSIQKKQRNDMWNYYYNKYLTDTWINNQKKYLMERKKIKSNPEKWYKKRYDADIQPYYEKKELVDVFMRNRAMTLEEYDEIADMPIFDEKYIFFGLQMTPEESTLPRAGVFVDQITSIQILAQAAEKYGIYVYVKEHFVQSYRDKRIYSIIKSIQNVRLIKSYINSIELISKALAVSTQTGTCILESAVMGKPVFVFGRGYDWKGIPNLFEICNLNDGELAIEKILKGYIIDQQDIINYFFAIQETSLFISDQNEELCNSSVKQYVNIIEKTIL